MTIYTFKVKFYCFLLLFFFTAASYAQLKFKIEHYSTEDGLSHDGVISMTKDREGFMWFGTWDGINRFDGHNFITYKARPGDNSVLKDNRVENIVEDKAGYLWLTVYNKQLYRFEKRTETFSSLSDIVDTPIIKNLAVNKIIPLANGAIWLNSNNQGLFVLTNLSSAHPKVTHYAQELAPGFGLPSNTIHFIYEDASRQVWVGTASGLCCFRADASGIYKSIKLNNQVCSANGFLCAAESNDRVWFGTAQGNMVVFSKSTGKIFCRQVTSSAVNGIVASRLKSAVYLATAKSQLITVNTTTLAAISAQMPNAQPFLSVFEDKAGRLWIEPEKHGVVKFEPGNNSFKYYFQSNDATFYNAAQLYSVIEYNKDMLWVSMKGGGFGMYNPATEAIDYFYDQPGSDSRQFSNLVTCKYLDPAGVLWLSTNDRGLNKVIFQRDDFNLKFLVKNTLNRSDNEVRGVFSDRQNRLWVASKSGALYIYDTGGKNLGSIFANTPAGGLGFVYSIIQDRRGSIWLGTKGNGLFRADPVDNTGSRYKLTHYLADDKDKNSLSSNLIYTLLEDAKGRIWVGTYGKGLNLISYQNKTVKFLNSKNALASYPKTGFDKIRNLRQDEKGNIWIATTEGLLILDPDIGDVDHYRYASYRKIPADRASLGNNNVQYIFRDAKNRMWVCTSGGGLNLAVGNDPFNALKFKIYTTADGLPNDYILSCTADDHGVLWLATENGLSRFEPSRGRFKNYDSYNGIPKAGFSESSSLKMPNGNLLFGCINGYIQFDPDKLIDHKVNERMALTNLQINNQDVVPTRGGAPLKYNINDTRTITLKYNQNIISIDFTVLDFRSGNKQAYAYRLYGFDNEWHSIKNQRRATYTNLPPGNYTFQVKSLSTNLYANAPAKTLAISILPPPWRTWWAYLIYISLAVVLIGAIRRTAITMLRLRQRISVERKLSDLKLSFFTNVSHELRTPLTLILNPIEEIACKENLSPKGQEYADIVRKNANRMVRFINQLLDLRKVQSGKAHLKLSNIEIIGFVKKISGYFKELALEKQVKLAINANSAEIFAWIDAEKIDIVIYNLLANAFKFTPAHKTIRVQIDQDADAGSFTLKIIDQGTGVAEDHLNDIFELYYEGDKAAGSHLKGTGIGLALSREFIQLHYGNITACNNPDGGLTVSVELKTGMEQYKAGDVTVLNAPEEFEQLTNISAEILLTNAGIVNEPANLNAPLVLLVEDNIDLRRFLALQLFEHYRIEEAGNGEEGYKKAKALLPDLIVSDVMMPKMNGIEMLDKLKNSTATSHIPVVLLTAKHSVENQIEGLRYGADYYITKPFNKDFLLASIENLLKQRKKIFDALLADKKAIELGPGEIVITSKDEAFLKEIIKIVENGMPDPDFNIDTVAETIGMGRTTFYKKFKSLTNLAPVEFVRDMRLKRGKQLLDGGEASVSEIAYAVGFNSAGYFSTCFKEKYHISPSEYLKNNELKTASAL